MLSFEATKEEFKLIIAIAKRAVRMAKDAEIEYDFEEAEMDVNATHSNGCPLDLEKLLNADDGNFGHDVFGIRRYIDRKTGKLTHCFLPRCAKEGGR